MNKSINISLRIVALFIMAIIISFIPDYFHTFLGDINCLGNINTHYCSSGYSQYSYTHGIEWHWAYRHWLFAAMGFFLAVVQVVNIIQIASKETIQ